MPTNQPARGAGQTNCIALDLGEAAIRVVEMELSSSGDGTLNRILKRGSAPLPPHVWNDLPSNREAFAAALRGALASAGISGRSVVACMPRRLVTVRFARLPSAPPEQMKQMVMFEAQQYILFSLDEVVLDYHLLKEPLPGFGTSAHDDMETVLLVAARRSLIDELLAIFDKAGLELRQLSVSALALAEHARDVIEPTALIDIQPGSMDVAVVADGMLLFTRATALELEGISPDVAQRKLDEEVARSFTAYQNEFRSKVLSHVYLSGSSAAVRDASVLERSLSNILEMPVSQLRNRIIPSADPELLGFATASGLALQTMPQGLVPISLVPDERAERLARQSKRLKQQLATVTAAAAIFAIIWFGRGAMAAHAIRDKDTIAANKILKDTKASLAVVQKKHDKLASLDQDLVRALDRNHSAVDMVVALHSALPPTSDIWLTQLTFQRNGLLTLRGESRNSTAPTDLVLALQACGAFSDVKLVDMSDAQETNLVAAPPTPAVDTTPDFQLPGFDTGQAQGNNQNNQQFPGMNPNSAGQGSGAQGYPNGQPGGNVPSWNAGPGAGTGQPTFPGGDGSGTVPTFPQRFRRGNRGGAQPTDATVQPDTSTQIIIQPDPSGGGGGPVQILAVPAAPVQVPGGSRQVVIMPDAPAKTATKPSPKPRQRPGAGQSGNITGAVTMQAGVTTVPRASSVPLRRATKPVRIAGPTKVTRTSFIITCKVNPNSTDLLAGISLTPVKVAAPNPSKSVKKKAVGSDTSDESGD